MTFPKLHLLQRGYKALIFCDFQYYHKSHLSWKSHWNSSNCSEDMKTLSCQYELFSSSFRIFLQFLVTKKLTTSAYNRWCWRLFIFNLLYIGCWTIVASYIDIFIFIYERGFTLTPTRPRPQKKTTPKKPILIRVINPSSLSLLSCIAFEHFNSTQA